MFVNVYVMCLEPSYYIKLYYTLNGSCLFYSSCGPDRDPLSVRYTTTTETQQWLDILADIYTYLCTMDETIRSALINTGPHPFTHQCRSPWGYVLNDPDTSPCTDLISDVLIGVRVAAMSDRLAEGRWLTTKGQPTHDTRHMHR